MQKPDDGHTGTDFGWPMGIIVSVIFYRKAWDLGLLGEDICY